MVGLNGGGHGGEIIEVKGGGHIIRSTNRKDRHSKVYTSKGARDRRVRLAAHTAIKFYDVQDRLGYDRPSKAVDWLIKNAQFSIDKLARLPPNHPSSAESTSHEFDFPTPLAPPDSTSFQCFPPEMISKGANQVEDLCLSLHPSQGPQELNQAAAFFSGGESVGRYQRMVLALENGGVPNKSGFVFHSPYPMPPPPQHTVQGPQFLQQSFFSVPIVASSSEDHDKGANDSSFGGHEYSRFEHTSCGSDLQRGRAWDN